MGSEMCIRDRIRTGVSVKGDIALVLNNNTAGTNRLYVRTDGDILTLNQPNLVVVTYDGTSLPGGVHIYVNGVDLSLTTVTNGLSATIVGTSSASMGSRNNNSLFYPGNFGVTKVYTRVITSTEVEEMYYNHKYPTTDLAAEYNFSEGSGTTLTDTSGNGLNGTISGATWGANKMFLSRSSAGTRTEATARTDV